MGLLKKIRKAVKKVVRQVSKPVESLAKGTVGALTGGAPQMPDIPEVAPPAQQVDIPQEQKVDTEDTAQTEAGRKKVRASGKKSLSVARVSGGGLNI